MLKTSKQAKIKHLSLNSEKKLETKIKKKRTKRFDLLLANFAVEL